MWWRITAREFDDNGNKGNRAAMRKLVSAGTVPGLLAYIDGAPVGWVSVGPREDFGRIERSPTFKRVDDTAVWSINCFFIHRHHRGEGIGRALLVAAIEYARINGAPAVEAYPIDPSRGQVTAAELYTGNLPTFERLGFDIVARGSHKRPLVRLTFDR